MSKKEIKRSALSILSGSIAFLSVLLLTQYLTYQEYRFLKDQEQKKLVEESNNIKDKFQNILSNCADAANILTIICAEYGFPNDFSTIASRILTKNKYVDAIALVKGDVITNVYPLKGRENIIGVNKSSNPVLWAELSKTNKKKEVHFIGPREMKEGGYGIMGQESVIIDGKLMGYSLVLTKLSTIQRELVRVNDKDSEFSYILSKKSGKGIQNDFNLNNTSPNNTSEIISVEIPEGDWRLKVAYSDNHQTNTLPHVFAFIGFALSFFSGLFVYRKVTKATQKLALSEDRFQTAFEQASIAKGIFQLDGSCVKVNKVFCKMLGYSHDEMTKLNFRQITYFDDLDNDLKYVQDLLDDKMKSYKVEKRYIHKEGFIVWAKLNLVIIRDNDNIPLYFVAEIEDITDRVESQTIFKDLVEKSGVGVYIVKDDKIVYTNSQFNIQLGYLTGESIIGLSLREFVYEEDLPMVHEKIRERLDGKVKNVRYEVRLNKKGGGVIWCEIFAATTIYQGETAVIGTAVNVTDTKNFYDKLQESEANMKSIFDATEVSFLLIDVDFKIVSFNEHLRQFHFDRAGKEPQSEISLLEQISPERRQNFRRLFEESIYTDRKVEYEEEYLTKGDLIKYYHYTLTPVKSNNEVIGLCIAITDITEQKRMEIERVQIIDNLLQRNRDLEQFSYIVSHNIRMPLSNLLGLITLLENDISQEDKMFFNEAVKESVLKLEDVVTDVNEILSIRKEEQQLTRENVEIERIIQKIQAEFKDSILKTNAKIVCDFSEISSIHTIPTYIHSIFLNMISNSLKFTSKDVSPEIKVWSEKEEGSVKICIQDNGIGIDLEKNGNKIFGLYKRFDLSKEGKGLGLFMVKNQVAALNGTIHIESRLGKGSTFIISLPLN